MEATMKDEVRGWR